MNVIAWRKYLKHFRRKIELPVDVPGLGVVKHWLLRYEPGDGLLGKRPIRDSEKWVDGQGWGTRPFSSSAGRAVQSPASTHTSATSSVVVDETNMSC